MIAKHCQFDSLFTLGCYQDYHCIGTLILFAVSIFALSDDDNHIHDSF